MTIPDTLALVAGIPLVAVIPGLVEVARRLGMPARYGGLAAIVLAMVLLGVASLALGEPRTIETAARCVIGGVVYGLAATGLSAQGLAPGASAPKSASNDH